MMLKAMETFWMTLCPQLSCRLDSCNDTITVGYPFTPPMIPEAAAHDVLCILQVSTHKAPYKKLATVPESEGEDISSEGVSNDTQRRPSVTIAMQTCMVMVWCRTARGQGVP